jgi:uncharacterized protein (DUF488 family)
MVKIFTIGHSNQEWSNFTATLKDNHIDVIVNVRRYPGSKTCPQFNKEEMIRSLEKENVSYVHIEELGGRRKRSDTKRSRYDDNSGWKNESFRAYANYMATTSFRHGIHEILSLMTNYENLAIMCAEAVPWRCHRRMIADYLTLVEGISVFDIIIGSKKQPQLHQVTSFAHLTDSKTSIIYPEK